MGGRKPPFGETLPWPYIYIHTPVTGFPQQPSEVLVVIIVMIKIIIVICWG